MASSREQALDRPHVVVGVDDSPESRVASGWAARYADRNGLSVLLVQAVPTAALAGHPPAVLHAVPKILDEGRDALARQAAKLRDDFDGDLEIRTRLETRPAWAALAERPGRRARGRGSRRRGRSAHCSTARRSSGWPPRHQAPFVVVPADDASWTERPVMLATDTTDHSTAAGRFAFRDGPAAGRQG